MFARGDIWHRFDHLILFFPHQYEITRSVVIRVLIAWIRTRHRTTSRLWVELKSDARSEQAGMHPCAEIADSLLHFVLARRYLPHNQASQLAHFDHGDGVSFWPVRGDATEPAVYR